MTKENNSMGRRGWPSLVHICCAVLLASCFQTASGMEFELEGDTNCLWGSKDCNACVGDVRASFNAMETKYTGERGSKIHVRSYAYPTKNYLLHRVNAAYEHIQGIGRIAGLGDDEYFVFTHSTKSAPTFDGFGNTPSKPAPGKSGALAVVRMAANKNSHGYAVSDLRERDGKNPKIHNRTVARTYSDSNHPGGLATLGHFVFVADWCQPHGNYAWCDNPSQYAFEIYDVSNGDNNVGAINSNPPIKVLSRSVYKAGDSLRNKSTASVAATRLSDKRYLVGIGRSGGKNYEYFLSDTKQITKSTKWSSVSDVIPIKKWAEGAAMVNECGSGDIYLIQMEKSANSVFDNTPSRDELHLFRLRKDSQTGAINHEYIKSRTFKCSDGTAWCDFDRGTGIYISPTRNLYLYATDSQQAKSTERFRMVEFGNYLDTGALREISNASCSNAFSTRLCANNGATCDVVGKNNAPPADVCRWAYANSAAACNGTVGIWTTPNSKYAKNHPTALASGSNGACLTEVNNIHKSLIDELTGGVATTGYFEVGNFEQQKAPPPQDDKKSALAAPSDFQVSDITSTTLKLSWMDNSDHEFGVELYRTDPDAARRNQKGSWKFIGLFEERVGSRVRGTGRRSDEDYELDPNTNYCYRLRAYSGFDRSEVSGYSKSICAKTKISKGENSSGLVAPSDLQVSDITSTTLTLSWSDNSDREFGVELYRLNPIAARRDQKSSWEFIGLFEERVDSRVKGTGRRSDEDYELDPDTSYCYRLRAYIGFSRSEVSDFSDKICTKTNR